MEETNKSCMEMEKNLEKVMPDLLKVLADAPEFGTCGISITFHKGKIKRILTQKEDSRVEEKE